MRAIVLSETGKPEVLRWTEAPTPQPDPGQVQIQVAVAGVNFGETMQRAGTYPLPLALPMTPGSEVVGIVSALGAGVTNLRVGERVAAMLVTEHGTWVGGGYAEVAVAEASRTFHLPDGVGDAEALAMFGQGLTAWFMLKDAAPSLAGRSVLVHAAAGGVGSLAVQLAFLLGASRVLGTAGTEAKRELVRSLGAEPIDYTDEGWPEVARAVTGGAGADVILDALGGAATARSLRALADHGTLVTFGALSGELPAFGPAEWGALIFGNKAVRGFGNGPYIADPGAAREALGTLFDHVAAGRLKVEAQRFALADAAGAHAAIEGRLTTGKVVLVP